MTATRRRKLRWSRSGWHRSVLWCVVAALSTLWMACPMGRSKPVVLNGDSQMDGPEALVVSTHASGVTVAHVPSNVAPVVAVWLRVELGSADDPVGLEGSAHLLEHVLTGGGARDIAWVRQIERAGGVFEATTTADHTTYLAVVPEQMGVDAVAWMLDGVGAPLAISEDVLRREAEVVVREMQWRNERPGHALARRVIDAAFDGDPAGRSPTGTRESVARLTVDHLQSWHREGYRAGAMHLVVVGAIDAAELGGALDRGASRVREGKPRVRLPHVATPSPRPHVVVEAGEGEVTTLAIGVVGPGWQHEDAPRLELWSQILARGETSILSERLARDGFNVVSQGGAYFATRNRGLLYVTISVDAGGDGARGVDALAALLDELARTRGDGVSPRRLATARLGMEVDLMRARESAQGYAAWIGDRLMRGDGWWDRSQRGHGDAFERTSLQAAALRWIRPENVVIGVMTHVDEHDADPGARTYGRVVADWSVDRPAYHVPAPDQNGVVRFTYPTGLVLVVQEDPSSPLVAIRAIAHGGSSVEDEGSAGTGAMLSRLITSGSRTRSAGALEQELASVGGTLVGFSGRRSVGLSMTIPAHAFDEGVEILADVWLGASYTQEAVERARRSWLAWHDMADRDGAHVAVRELSRAVFAGHPYATPVEGTRDSLRSITAADVRGYHRGTLHPSRTVIAVVGAVDTSVVVARVGRWLDRDLPDSPFRVQGSALSEATPAGGATLELLRDAPGSHVAVGYRVPGFVGADAAAMDVLVGLWGGPSGLVARELRDTHALAYATHVGYVESATGGMLYVYGATSDGQEDALVARIEDLVTFARTGGVSDPEVQEALTRVAGERLVAAQSAESRAIFFSQDTLVGGAAGTGDNLVSLVAPLRREDVVRVANLVFTEANRSTVVVRSRGVASPVD